MSVAPLAVIALANIVAIFGLFANHTHEKNFRVWRSRRI